VKRVGLLGLLLCALLLRAGIPTGMMLVSAEGGPRLVPCPSTWGVAAAAPAAHHGGHHGARQQPDHDHKGQEPPCPFGVLLFPGMPPAPPAFALRMPEPAPVPAFAVATQAPARPPDHLHPPATGPPLRA
jgi:hypothetical protein